MWPGVDFIQDFKIVVETPTIFGVNHLGVETSTF